MARPGSEESAWLGSNLDALIDQVIAAIANPPPDINGWPAFELQKYIGEEYKTTLDSPPAVVWVPRPETYMGPRDQPDDGRAVLDAYTTCDIFCWGETGRQAEDLRNAVLGTLWTQFSPNAEKPTGGGRWFKTISSGIFGVEVQCGITFRIPILGQVWQPAQVTSVTITSNTNGVPTSPATPGVTVSDWSGGNPEALP
jgi:hypothetical protein